MTETMPDRIQVARVISTAPGVWEMTLPWLPIYWDMDVLARYKRAGFTFVSLTLQDWPPTFEGMKRCIARFQALAESEAAWLTFGKSLEDIDRGRRAGKLVLGLNSQETRIIEDDLSRIAALRELGVRHMLLAYNVRNVVADGCAEVADAGLSNFGRQVIREMNRVGVIVDCSHTGRRSSLEAMEISERPVIFSHSNVHSICPHIRNIHDDQIRACAAGGGVVGVVGVGAFLGSVAPSSDDLFRHIDYISSLVGPDHVGLGTDYVSILPIKEHAAVWEARASELHAWPDPANAWRDPSGTQIPFEETRCVPPEAMVSLVETMLIHGYSESVVQGILGANFRRVYAGLPQ